MVQDPMTYFTKLAPEEKSKIEAEWASGKTSDAIQQAVRSDLNCAECWRSWYNCVCGHDDDE